MRRTGQKGPAPVAEERCAPGETAPSKSPPAARSRQGSSRASQQHHCRDAGSPLLAPQAPRVFAFSPGCQDAQALSPQFSTPGTARECTLKGVSFILL